MSTVVGDKGSAHVFETTKLLGYSFCRLADNADLFVSSCMTHAGTVQMGSDTIILAALAAAALMASFGTRALA